MIKIFLSVLGLIALAFLFDGEAYRIFVRAFDYSLDFSVFTLAAVFVFILYLTHLALKPFEWFKNYRHTKALVQASRHQNLLFDALNKNTENEMLLNLYQKILEININPSAFIYNIVGISRIISVNKVAYTSNLSRVYP